MNLLSPLTETAQKQVWFLCSSFNHQQTANSSKNVSKTCSVSKLLFSIALAFFLLCHSFTKHLLERLCAHRKSIYFLSPLKVKDSLCMVTITFVKASRQKLVDANSRQSDAFFANITNVNYIKLLLLFWIQ